MNTFIYSVFDLLKLCLFVFMLLFYFESIGLNIMGQLANASERKLTVLSNSNSNTPESILIQSCKRSVSDKNLLTYKQTVQVLNGLSCSEFFASNQNQKISTVLSESRSADRGLLNQSSYERGISSNGEKSSTKISRRPIMRDKRKFREDILKGKKYRSMR